MKNEKWRRRKKRHEWLGTFVLQKKKKKITIECSEVYTVFSMRKKSFTSLEFHFTEWNCQGIIQNITYFFFSLSQKCARCICTLTRACALLLMLYADDEREKWFEMIKMIERTIHTTHNNEMTSCHIHQIYMTSGERCTSNYVWIVCNSHVHSILQQMQKKIQFIYASRIAKND